MPMNKKPIAKKMAAKKAAAKDYIPTMSGPLAPIAKKVAQGKAAKAYGKGMMPKAKKSK
jgi:hypothetical protein